MGFSTMIVVLVVVVIFGTTWQRVVVTLIYLPPEPMPKIGKESWGAQPSVWKILSENVLTLTNVLEITFYYDFHS
jgi:hypothetical protein